MIRFSAVLVAIAIGVLVAGMAASSLLLVYVAIGMSVAALLTLVFGVALKREEIFGQQGQLALVGQGANAGIGPERPGSAVPGGQDVLREPFGQQAAAFGQAAWAAAPDTHSERPGLAAPGPKLPPWRERFASPAPQQPVAQTRVDTALTPVDVAQTRADLGKTRTDLTETKADAAPGRLAALSWFERIAPARPAGDEPAAEASAEDHDGDIKTEDADAADSPVDEADSPAGDAHAEAGDTTIEDATADATEEEEAEAAVTDAAADTAAEDTDAEDSASADAADSSPDGDQEGHSGQREVTVVPGVPRYHDAKCILIRFMGDDDLQKMPLDEATEAGCTPCKACMSEHA